VLSAQLCKVYSNVASVQRSKAEDSMVGENTCIDYGEEEFTMVRHPPLMPDILRRM
jgi:hypothetical protein